MHKRRAQFAEDASTSYTRSTVLSAEIISSLWSLSVLRTTCLTSLASLSLVATRRRSSWALALQEPSTLLSTFTPRPHRAGEHRCCSLLRYISDIWT